MSKPEEITQDAWDAGMKEARFYADWLHAGNSSGSVSPHAVTALADTIARAIVAAEKRGEDRERGACAAVADEYVWDDHALAQATAIGKAVHYQSVEISAAIRKRGEG